KNSFIGQVGQAARECLEIIQSKGWGPDDFKFGKNSGLLTFLGQNAAAKHVTKCKVPGGRIQRDFTIAENWPGKNFRPATDMVTVAREQLVPRLEKIIALFEHKYRLAL